MVNIKVVAMFDDRAVLQQARDEVIRSGLATSETVHAEPEILDEPVDPPSLLTGWDRLRALFDTAADHDISAYAEGLRRGSALLVVETASEKAEQVKDVLRRSGAIDLRRRVNRWITTGWETFDPSALTFTELEIVDERRACVSEAATAGDDDDHLYRNVLVFEEKTGLLLGRISEAELSVLHGALEEEGPDDDDYWLNDEAIATIVSRPGATPHLIEMLRRAVGGSPDGADIRFEREAGPRAPCSSPAMDPPTSLDR